MARFRLLQQSTPLGLSILRVVLGVLFREHETQKIVGFPHSDKPGPALFSLQGGQGMIEPVGGIVIVIGLLTRSVAFTLCGDMAAAYLMAHAPRSFFLMLNGGDAAILYCFAFLYFVFAGGGVWSVDEAPGRSRARTTN